MMFSFLLQAQQQGGNWSMLVMLGLMFVIMYFFMFRPQQKKAKEQKQFIEEVKRGDYVVTIGGAHGRVAELEGDTFILEVEKGGRIRFSKTAISMESSKAAAKKES